MSRIRTLNRALWGMNVLIGAAVLVFCGRSLVVPPKVHRLDDVSPRWADPSPPSARPEPPFEEAMAQLRNPLRPPTGPTPPAPLDAELIGVLPASPPRKGVAFFRSRSGRVDMMAMEGEEVRRHGRPLLERTGYALVGLGMAYAILRNRQGDEICVQMEALDAAEEGKPPAMSRTGEAYRSERYASRLLASIAGREIWGIDANEADWAAQNVQVLLDRDVRISRIAGGGLRIDDLSPDSLPAVRGVKPGDILREMDGRPLSTIGDLQAILSSPPKPGLQLTLERAGRTVVIEYRLLPKANR